jgi:hypothetical protein
LVNYLSYFLSSEIGKFLAEFFESDVFCLKFLLKTVAFNFLYGIIFIRFLYVLVIGIRVPLTGLFARRRKGHGRGKKEKTR